jgi:twitching motility protein PilT
MVDVDISQIEPLLRELWRHRATDLLLTAGSPPLMRIDGVVTPLADAAPLTEADTTTTVRTLLGTDDFARFEREREFDFAFSWAETGRFRGNAFHQRGTVALALRLIPMQIPTFEQLGLPAIAEDIAYLPQGFVIVTGPTGSGKSTTLASILNKINEERQVHIVTIEDPIEYVHSHKKSAVNQREVGSDTDSFSSGLRSAFREDPDVLLVGEMRDNETIAAALTLAETGHLVFATLHTNDAAQTLDRVVDVFQAEQQAQIRVQLAGTLQVVMSQRLIPRNGGGRVAAFEVLVANYAVRNTVRDGRTNQLRNLIVTGSKDGMVTLEQSLSELVASGAIDYEVALDHTLFPNEVQRPVGMNAESA